MRAFLLFLLFLDAHASSSIPTDIILLAGQSNMSGRGGVINDTWDGVLPTECRPNAAVHRLSAELTWVEAIEPLHRDIDVTKTCGVGPGMAFANSVLRKDSSFGVVGLVPCAIGGTNISEWGRGRELYNRLLRRAGAAVEGGGRIRAMLWYQGESDTVSRMDAELYKRRLERLFTDLRADLRSPLLPVIQMWQPLGRDANMFLFLLFLLLAQKPSLSHASQVKNIVLLAGQSNMSGRGGVFNGTWDSIIPSECRPNRSILRLTANLTWVKAHEPLHKDIDINTTCGVGPGMSFANALLRLDPRNGVIGLVPCAVGGTRGTRMNEWVRGSYLYDQLVKRAAAARQEDASLLALLWYQGESDTVNQTDALLYKGRLEKLFTDLRADLQSPGLPVIQVALASGQGAYVEIVRKAQLGIKLPNVRCVDARGLQLNSDDLHLSTPAQVRLGKLLADALVRTVRNP